jgi:hypothetical protein
MPYNKTGKTINVIPRHDRGIHILRQAQDDWIGTRPVIDTGVEPYNDRLFMTYSLSQNQKQKEGHL